VRPTRAVREIGLLARDDDVLRGHSGERRRQADRDAIRLEHQHAIPEEALERDAHVPLAFL
jgi:hypothetical protein